MRTTIELTDDQRAKLLALAAKRRLWGYSVLIQEALERYLKGTPNGGRTRAARAARKMRGTLSEVEAERMRRRIEAPRKRWR
jgi:Arc/MetJ-type ribon-helix-helix transcriptional regulator